MASNSFLDLHRYSNIKLHYCLEYSDNVTDFGCHCKLRLNRLNYLGRLAQQINLRFGPCISPLCTKGRRNKTF